MIGFTEILAEPGFGRRRDAWAPPRPPSCETATPAEQLHESGSSRTRRSPGSQGTPFSDWETPLGPSSSESQGSTHCLATGDLSFASTAAHLQIEQEQRWPGLSYAA